MSEQIKNNPIPGSLEFCQLCEYWDYTNLMPDGECQTPGPCPCTESETPNCPICKNNNHITEQFPDPVYGECVVCSEHGLQIVDQDRLKEKEKDLFQE